MESNFLDWIKKAESDWKAVRILSASENPPKDIILFHCQQVAEKYLKAYLLKSFGVLEKTHNLLKLSQEVERKEPSINILRNDFLVLIDFAVQPRYPGDYAEPRNEDVRQAIAAAKRIRYFFRKLLVSKKRRK